MSADTTVVIAAHRRRSGGELEYTAAVVQAVEDFFYEESDAAWRKASAYFLEVHHPWFSKLSRAKQFASLIAEEQRDRGQLEYENRPMIEIGNDGRVYPLSRRGRRKQPEHDQHNEADRLDAQLDYADRHYGCTHPAPKDLFD